MLNGIKEYNEFKEKLKNADMYACTWIFTQLEDEYNKLLVKKDKNNYECCLLNSIKSIIKQ